jgi:precorrin-6Y C5,15-methyltransferase (decarboxylating)
VLARWYGRWGGELVRLAVAHAAPVGGFTGWRQAMPVTQWSAVRPAGPGSAPASAERADARPAGTEPANAKGTSGRPRSIERGEQS